MTNTEATPPTGGLHHVELYASDFDASAAFWNWFLDELGYEERNEAWEGGRSWGRGSTYLVLLPADEDGPFSRHKPGLNHLAFHAESREHVDAVSEGVRERDDATLLYADRHPHAGGEDHYALYCENPDGLKVELVAPE